jgi:hypothetical protein
MQTGSSANGGDASPPDYGTAVAYLQELEGGLRYWYQAAEIKAQVVLAINGALVALLSGSLLGNRDDVARTVTVFGPETWVFLVGMTTAFALSIACAVICLVARGLQRKRVGEEFDRYGVDPSDAATYAPEVTAFFFYLAALESAPFTERMRTVDQAFVLRALSSNPVRFARNILRKHRWVNRAFVLTGVGLGFFLCLGVSYLIRVVLAG